MNKPIRLFWGENYSSKPPYFIKAVKKAVTESIETINLYPGSVYQDTINVVAESLHIKPQQIIFGHGIEGLIHLTSQTFLSKSKAGGMFEPSFYVYGDNLKRFNSISYPCNPYEKIDADNLLKTIEKTDLFFLASPNTATGNYLLKKEEIEFILKHYKGLFVVDECYYGIGDLTIIKLINEYDNLLVLRGVTKVIGMGSIRLGFAAGSKGIIDKLVFNHTTLESDAISTFSLRIFKEIFPFYQRLAANTRKFISEFLVFVKQNIPEATFLQSMVTYQFMDIKKYGVPAYKVINYLNKNGFLMSLKDLTDNSSLPFPDLIKFPPPPKEFWQDFVKTLQEALTTQT